MALKFRKFLISLSEKGRETLNVRAVFREIAIDIKKNTREIVMKPQSWVQRTGFRQSLVIRGAENKWMGMRGKDWFSYRNVLPLNGIIFKVKSFQNLLV